LLLPTGRDALATPQVSRCDPRQSTTLGGMVNMGADIGKYLPPALAGTLIGIAVLKWEWLLNVFGISAHIERGTALVTFEYWLGFVAAAVLGFLFPRHPGTAGAFLMAGPTILMHSVHIAQGGVPQQWFLELFMLAALTVPYVGLAALVAYLRQRNSRAANAT